MTAGAGDNEALRRKVEKQLERLAQFTPTEPVELSAVPRRTGSSAPLRHARKRKRACRQEPLLLPKSHRSLSSAGRQASKAHHRVARAALP
jgi:hypothetical protein